MFRGMPSWQMGLMLLMLLGISCRSPRSEPASDAPVASIYVARMEPEEDEPSGDVVEMPRLKKKRRRVAAKPRPAVESPAETPGFESVLVLRVEWRPSFVEETNQVGRPIVSQVMGQPAPTPLLPIRARAVDYRWLMGTLAYEPERHTWTVRYAEANTGDFYQGQLDLVHPGPMDGFAIGEEVRVEGELLDPAPYEVKPGYQVRTIQALRGDVAVRQGR